MLIKEQKSKHRFIQRAFLSLSDSLSFSRTCIQNTYVRLTLHLTLTTKFYSIYRSLAMWHREDEDPVFLDIMGTTHLVHSDSLGIQSRVLPLKIYKTLLALCTLYKLKHFIIQQMHKYITVDTIRIIIKSLKYLKLLQRVSDHKRSIIRELYIVLG